MYVYMHVHEYVYVYVNVYGFVSKTEQGSEKSSNQHLKLYCTVLYCTVQTITKNPPTARYNLSVSHLNIRRMTVLIYDHTHTHTHTHTAIRNILGDNHTR